MNLDDYYEMRLLGGTIDTNYITSGYFWAENTTARASLDMLAILLAEIEEEW